MVTTLFSILLWNSFKKLEFVRRKGRLPCCAAVTVYYEGAITGQSPWRRQSCVLLLIWVERVYIILQISEISYNINWFIWYRFCIWLTKRITTSCCLILYHRFSNLQPCDWVKRVWSLGSPWFILWPLMSPHINRESNLRLHQVPTF